MNLTWQELAGQLGVAAVLAVFFYILLRAYLQRTSELLEDKRLAESKLLEKTAECASLAERFLQSADQFAHTAEAFNITLSNHLVHSELAFEQQTEALKAMTTAIDKMCMRLDKN